MTSPSGCVLVYDSVGELARQSVRGSGEQSASGSEFEVGRATSAEDFSRRASRRDPLAAVAGSWYWSRLKILVAFQAFICNRVSCCRYWRRHRRGWVRGSVHWRREREHGAQETGCCYQKTGTARWETPALSSCGRLKRNSERTTVGEGVRWGYTLFQMSIFLDLLNVCSMFVNHFPLFFISTPEILRLPSFRPQDIS